MRVFAGGFVGFLGGSYGLFMRILESVIKNVTGSSSFFLSRVELAGPKVVFFF